MRITLPHRYDFGADAGVVGDDLGRSEAWDALRTGTAGPFALAGTRADWERQADSVTGLEQRAAAIDAWLEARGVTTVASYGVGAGLLELRLHACDPGRRLILGDYAPDAVTRLAALFPEADVRTHTCSWTPRSRRAYTSSTASTPSSRATSGVACSSTSRASRCCSWQRMCSTVRAASWPPSSRWCGCGRPRAPAGFARATRSRPLFRPTHVATPLAIHDLAAWALEPRPNL